MEEERAGMEKCMVIPSHATRNANKVLKCPPIRGQRHEWSRTLMNVSSPELGRLTTNQAERASEFEGEEAKVSSVRIIDCGNAHALFTSAYVCMVEREKAMQGERCERDTPCHCHHQN